MASGAYDITSLGPTELRGLLKTYNIETRQYAAFKTVHMQDLIQRDYAAHTLCEY